MQSPDHNHDRPDTSDDAPALTDTRHFAHIDEGLVLYEERDATPEFGDTAVFYDGLDSPVLVRIMPAKLVNARLINLETGRAEAYVRDGAPSDVLGLVPAEPIAALPKNKPPI